MDNCSIFIFGKKDKRVEISIDELFNMCSTMDLVLKRNPIDGDIDIFNNKFKIVGFITRRY
ncbi:MAG: hypothetical protein MJZ37_08375 [Bacilli bacterium]|nr:hypothetical protein [Bacilli bacterium]